MKQSQAEQSTVAWPLLVAELLSLRKQRIHLSSVQPDSLTRVFAQADRDGGENIFEALQEALLSHGPPRAAIRLEFDVQAPLWRLAASDPEAAEEIGNALPCHARVVLPAGYPLTPLTQGHGGSIELSVSGTLGREASAVASREAHVKMGELHRESTRVGAAAPAEYLLGLVDWISSTELHELGAAVYQSSGPTGSSPSAHVRAFVRFHHVLARMKRAYMRMWAEDLEVGALLAAGQPAMLLVEGPVSNVRALISRVTKAIHWGPTPARIVGSQACSSDDGRSLQVGLVEAGEAFPEAVARNGTYNGRDSVDYALLGRKLTEAGYSGAGRELLKLSSDAFAHVNGRVQDAEDGTGWVGYRLPEPKLAEPLAQEASAGQQRRRYAAHSKESIPIAIAASQPITPSAAQDAAGSPLPKPAVARRWGRK